VKRLGDPRYEEAYDILLMARYRSIEQDEAVTLEDYTSVTELYVAYVKYHRVGNFEGEPLAVTHFGRALRQMGWADYPISRTVGLEQVRGLAGVQGPASVKIKYRRERHPNGTIKAPISSGQTLPGPSVRRKAPATYISLRSRIKARERVQPPHAVATCPRVGGGPPRVKVSRHGPPPRF